MTREDFAALQPHLEPAHFELRKILHEANQPIKHVYFPESGLLSITTKRGSEERIEVGIIGREGMAGVAIVLGVDRAPFEVFAQIEGHGFCLATHHLEAALDERRSLDRLLRRYTQAGNVQTCATAIANAEHTLESRLARWLLMCHDRVDGDAIPLTHEFMSMMLGVRRAGVTTALHILEGNLVIRARRGVVTIRDRARLEEMADGAYGLPEAEYARLMNGH